MPVAKRLLASGSARPQLLELRAAIAATGVRSARRRAGRGDYLGRTKNVVFIDGAWFEQSSARRVLRLPARGRRRRDLHRHDTVMAALQDVKRIVWAVASVRGVFLYVAPSTVSSGRIPTSGRSGSLTALSWARWTSPRSRSTAALYRLDGERPRLLAA